MLVFTLGFIVQIFNAFFFFQNHNFPLFKKIIAVISDSFPLKKKSNKKQKKQKKKATKSPHIVVTCHLIHMEIR